jgi:hypothetical protein
VITEGVTPSLHIDYKHCRIKQYHKHGRALRTGRVAATHCCAAAPSGPCMRVPAHTAQAGPSGCSGRPLLFYGASCCPGGACGWSVPDFIDNGLGCQVGEFPES